MFWRHLPAWPRQRGLDHFDGITDGVTHYFSPYNLIEDDNRIAVYDNDFYFTDAITNKAITMIERSVADQQSYFLYLAHTHPIGLCMPGTKISPGMKAPTAVAGRPLERLVMKK